MRSVTLRLRQPCLKSSSTYGGGYLGIMDDQMFDALVDIGNGLELEQTLRRILRSAVAVSGATYGALGVINKQGCLTSFLTEGMDAAQIQAIDHWPRGDGLIGHLITDPRPLRLDRIGDHPESAGFPKGHPPMTSFLGVPILYGRELLGNLYMTDKAGGFTAIDEERIVGLATVAGIAIHNSHLFENLSLRQRCQSLSGQLATTALAGQGLEHGLLISAQGVREATGADACLMTVVEDSQHKVVVLDQHPVEPGQRALATPIGVGDVLRPDHQLHQWTDSHPCEVDVTLVDGETIGNYRFCASLPFSHKGQEMGSVSLLFHDHPPGHLDLMDTLDSCIQHVATVLALDRQRHALDQAALYRDRDRIARELHDSVSQRIFATGMMLEAASQRSQDSSVPPEIVREAIAEMDAIITEIRITIADLREPVADHVAMLQRETQRAAHSLGFTPDTVVTPGIVGVPDEVWQGVRAVMIEGLSNVAKHAGATAASVSITREAGLLRVVISDNGSGVDDPGGRRSGLANLEQRARELGGELSVSFGGPGQGFELEWTARTDR